MILDFKRDMSYVESSKVEDYGKHQRQFQSSASDDKKCATDWLGGEGIEICRRILAVEVS